MLDLRLVNATVVTMDPRRPAAREIGIADGRIVAVDEPLPARRVVDLQGATVLPGFIDPHVHLAATGLRASTPSLAPCDDRDRVLGVIAEAARSAPADGWVDIVGYDQRPLGGHLTAADLDAVSGGRKVFVIHDSGHACVVSTPVLRLLPDGVPHDSGVLAEQGLAAVRKVRLPYPVDQLVDAIETAARTCLSEGVTACAEAGIGGGLVGHSAVEAAVFQEARERGRLPIRVQLMVTADALHAVDAHPADGIARALDLGLRTGFGDDWLSIGALKVFTDGGMMARTAALTSPYTGLDTSGQLYADEHHLTAQIVDGHRAGWQVAIHAIGDRAIDVALAALERAQRDRPRPHARHRIEHAGLVRPDQLERFAAVGATAVVQPNFLVYNGEDYGAIMGESRLPWLYRGRAFLDHRIPLVGSSDRPVTAGAPLRAIQFMVERTADSGLVIGPDESVTVDDALRAYTVEAARACHWEESLGTIAPGKWADLVVLADDPRHVQTTRIGQITVLATIVGGVPAHGDVGI